MDNVEDQLGRIRQDISILMATAESTKRRINMTEQLKAELHRAHREKVAFLERAQKLEERAAKVEQLAEQVEAQAVHRAELADWRRVQRRITWVIVLCIVMTAAFLSWQLILHTHEDEDLRQQQQQTKQSLCALMAAASQLHSTPQSVAVAAEASKLLVQYGCH